MQGRRGSHLGASVLAVSAPGLARPPTTDKRDIACDPNGRARLYPALMTRPLPKPPPLLLAVIVLSGLVGCDVDHETESAQGFRAQPGAQGIRASEAPGVLEAADAEPWAPFTFAPVELIDFSEMICCQQGVNSEIKRRSACFGIGATALPSGACLTECCELSESRERIDTASCLAQGGRAVPAGWCSRCRGNRVGDQVWTLCPGLDYAGAGVCNPNGSDCSDVDDGTVIGVDHACGGIIGGCLSCPPGTLAKDLDGDGCEELCDCDGGPLP